MRIIAIDYGKKRSGIAVTDPEQIIAHPLETVDTKILPKFIDNYLHQQDVEEIVFGHPKHSDDTDAEIFDQIKKFADKIDKKYKNIKINFWDERYTSKRAVKSMVEAGYKKKQRRKKENIDKIAATIILQDYLESKK